MRFVDCYMAPSVKVENFSCSEKIIEQGQNGDKTRGTKKKGFGNYSETLDFNWLPGTYSCKNFSSTSYLERKRCRISRM